jgi:hypothetical protein
MLYKKIAITKVAYFWTSYCCVSFEDYVGGAGIATMSQVHVSSMLLLVVGNKKCDTGVTSKGVTIIPYLTKISHLVQKLKEEPTDT